MSKCERYSCSDRKPSLLEFFKGSRKNSFLSFAFMDRTYFHDGMSIYDERTHCLSSLRKGLCIEMGRKHISGELFETKIISIAVVFILVALKKCKQAR